MSIDRGFAGKVLYVDLGSRRIETRPLRRSDAERLIGAAGINARLAYEMIPAGCDPLGPDNVLVYGVGPFAGTMVPGAARTVISAKSPLTGYYGTSAAGHFGMMLKLAGYDHLVVTGRAHSPCYLRIFDDQVSIEDASHLWGKDIYDTTDAVWRESPQAWVSCIGQAGENLVKHAVIINNKYSTYGSTGLGAVMGSKNLKAVVAFGSGAVRVADPKGFLRQTDRVFKALMQGRHVHEWRKLGTLIQFQSNANGADEDMARRGFDMHSWTDVYTDKLWKAPVTCPGCPVGCKARLEIDEGEREGTKLPISCPAGTVTGPYAMSMSDPVRDWAEVARCSEMANRYGISTFGSVHAFSWLIDLFERGVIDSSDTFGLELKRGDPLTYQKLIHLTAHREGIGDVLAGSYEEVFARIGKATEPIRPDERIYRGKSTKYATDWNVSDFAVAVDPRQSGPPNAYSSITMVPGRSQQSLEDYARRLGASPSEADACVTGGTDGYRIGTMTKVVEAYNLVLYSVSSCQRPFISRVLDIDTLAGLYTTATGIAVTPHDLLEGAERTITLQRMFNVREGMNRSVEMARPHCTSDAQRRDLAQMLDEYYESHGWDAATGIPPASRIAELGLQDVVSSRPASARASTVRAERSSAPC